jgi:hypothetical protein
MEIVSDCQHTVKIHFSNNAKIFASLCGQEADVCVELTKIAAV